MITVLIQFGDTVFDDGYNEVKFICDRQDLHVIEYYVDDMEYYQNEYIMFIDGVPVRWSLWYDGRGRA